VATAVINIIAYLYGRPVAEKLRRRRSTLSTTRPAGQTRVCRRKTRLCAEKQRWIPPPHAIWSYLSRKTRCPRSGGRGVCKRGAQRPCQVYSTSAAGARPYGEVAVVDPHGSVIAVGRLMYSARELTLKRGYAVRVRESLKKATESQKEPRQ